ncbi:C-terminal processing protease CtpA/Prc, contains a PDZ domain [Flavobacterium gillisiae]|uniref:C-terminal processing protease CtpA/Prc, contains a PDZ domain n=1 Tax=Flavobacterium gillisiae TaxID=150146 RepID=A0A1H4FGH7_9FLAO|nr:S41 family peptidase [Flavobacterium gillisiae]SEA96459.1 C-terminal processing protease CtpA/Prc, contains a PDZ domain [Flavobacterium gillisiae]
MKPTLKFALLLLLVVFSFQSCQDNDDTAAPINLEVQDFIWKGLNQYYLWQPDVPNLSDDRFASQDILNVFLRGYPVPEELFDALRVDKSIDRFSWIVDDYLELEGALQGITKNSGIEFGLVYKPGSTTDIFGYVRYIIPGSDAATKDIKRGAIFYGINGTQLTISNYQSLLANDTFTLNLADYNSGAITPNNKTVALTKTVLSENPILINKVITNGTHKIGYLLYNGFYADYDNQLNDAFGSLKSQGITDLVLDLRYNGGGSVLTATRLASMITGQYTGKVFAKQQWNPKINSYFESNNPEALKNNFTDKIGTTAVNSLNLSKIYILTTKSTASASELVINGLKPYMTVVQIGDITTGKNVGSVTLYDSPTFGKDNRNPNHRYAMQPIVLKIVNAAGFGDYFNGLTPDYSLKENYGNLDVLGNSTEPLLSTAIGKITGTGKMLKQSPEKDFNYFSDTKSLNGIQNQMYLEKAPEGILKALE